MKDCGSTMTDYGGTQKTSMAFSDNSLSLADGTMLAAQVARHSTAPAAVHGLAGQLWGGLPLRRLLVQWRMPWLLLLLPNAQKRDCYTH
jgi:hypothetical protein